MLYTIFFICFGVGVGFVLLSFLVGEFSDGIEADSALSFLRPSIGATFLVVFGGVGLLVEGITFGGILIGGVVAVGIAFFAGFFISLCFHRFVIIPLKRMENTSAIDRQMLVGHEATVIEQIPQGHFGKISFTTDQGNKHSAPAKSDDGNAIPRHATVEIIYIEKNTYFVRQKGV